MVQESTTLSIRAAGQADARALALLRTRSLIEMGLLDEDIRTAQSFIDEASLRIEALFARERLAASLLLDGPSPAGCACVVFWNRLPYPDGFAHAEIAGVYVAPEYRRRGHATTLTRAAIEAARARSVRKIVLYPTAEARTLYERLGFTAADQLQLRC
jgi:ribosomal protein S18 acetylase RimI-like enzyme